jgi:CubicO group peptidase (beta-lactamase class C family)
VGYTLLSMVAETLSGKSFADQIQDAVLKPLNLNHTFVTAPSDSLGIIPGNRYSTSWAFEMGDEAP